MRESALGFPEQLKKIGIRGEEKATINCDKKNIFLEENDDS